MLGQWPHGRPRWAARARAHAHADADADADADAHAHARAAIAAVELPVQSVAGTTGWQFPTRPRYTPPPRESTVCRVLLEPGVSDEHEEPAEVACRGFQRWTRRRFQQGSAGLSRVRQGPTGFKTGARLAVGNKEGEEKGQVLMLPRFYA
ncbi:hypothetical protein E4U53_003792 [Claviceps sorghi]|nr:hypothetical protein E4U53_003792 [Claviceps sorghi]